jgi:hypothetical protein
MLRILPFALNIVATSVVGFLKSAAGECLAA